MIWQINLQFESIMLFLHAIENIRESHDIFLVFELVSREEMEATEFSGIIDVFALKDCRFLDHSQVSMR